jgi:hypothetical protein
MAGLLFKWLIIPITFLSFARGDNRHPIYVSVTEIEHNAKAKTLEISCKIFTDDFEKTLRAAYNTHVDLLDPKEKAAMDKLVNDYVQKHLKVAVNGAPVALKYLGYERIDEGIYSYYQADNILSVKKIAVTDNILYEYKDQQLSLIHVIVNGDRKSTKLNNPEDKFSIEY